MATFNEPAGSATLQLNVTVGDTSGNSSRVDWSLYLYCYNGLSFNLSSNVPWNVNIGGNTDSGTFAFDFRSTSSKRIASGSTWIGHNSDGRKTISVSGFKGADGASDVGDNVTVSGSVTLPRIPKPPDAPSPIGLDLITPTSMRYRFSSNDNNGATVTQWQVQYSKASNFSGATTITSNGTSTLSGLTPGTTYYVRARGRNSAGWGAWSSSRNARTLSGAYVRRGSTWKPVEVLVYRSGQWRTAEVLVYRSGAWVPAT